MLVWHGLCSEKGFKAVLCIVVPTQLPFYHDDMEFAKKAKFCYTIILQTLQQQGRLFFTFDNCKIVGANSSESRKIV